MTVLPLSYLQAARAKQSGKISWEEYIQNLLVSWTGVRDEEDNDEGIYFPLRKADPFAYCVYCSGKRMEPMAGQYRRYQPAIIVLGANTHITITDTSAPEAVYNAYRRSTLEDVKAKFAVLDGPPAKAVKKSLAFLALQERQTDVFKFFMDEGGFPFEAYFHIEADSVDEEMDPETFKVLEQSRFRKLVPRIKPGQGGNDLGIRDPSAIFDKCGKLPIEW